MNIVDKYVNALKSLEIDQMYKNDFFLHGKKLQMS
ncbi:hypothetical protein BJV39_003897 [Clostridium beijerinckii]|nr:hypothetical protein [Clostridium beijerinckii]